MADELNGQALPVHHTECFIRVSDQTLAEQLYLDKGLLVLL